MTARDCPHGHQKGKCDTCSLIDLEQRVSAAAELIENVITAVERDTFWAVSNTVGQLRNARAILQGDRDP